MNLPSYVGVAAFAAGVAGLVACNLAVGYTLPNDWVARWRRYRRGRAVVVETSHQPTRRVITGTPAAQRIDEGERPARHRALRPDDLSRERQRLAVEESRRTVEELLDQDPSRLAEVVDLWLAQDRREAADDARPKT